MSDKEVTLYDVLKAIENSHAEIMSVSNRLDKFQQEMYKFRDEMYEFKDRTDKQLDLSSDKVNKSINGAEALNQRVWNLEKQCTIG